MRGSGYRVLRGVASVLLASFLWGTSGVAAKLSFGLGVRPEGILTVRFLLTIPIYLVLVLSRKPSRGSLVSTAVLGVSVLGPFQLAYYYSINYVGASTAAMVYYTYPALVALMSHYILREGIDRRVYIALVLSILGAVLVSLGSPNLELLGITLAATSSALFSLYVVVSRKLMEFGFLPVDVAIGSSVWSLPPILALQLVSGPRQLVTALKLEVVMIAVYLAAVVTALAYVLYMRGLRIIGASKAAIISTAEPLTAMVLSNIVFSETITELKAVGGVFIVLAIAMISRSPLRRSKVASNPASG